MDDANNTETTVKLKLFHNIVKKERKKERKEKKYQRRNTRNKGKEDKESVIRKEPRNKQGLKEASTK